MALLSVNYVSRFFKQSVVISERCEDETEKKRSGSFARLRARKVARAYQVRACMLPVNDETEGR